MIMKITYQENIQLDTVARAMSKNRPISVKYATEICREIRGQPVEKALSFLQDVVDKKRYLPMRKFVRNIPHRKGQSQSRVKSGRYPKNACNAFIELIESAKNNATQKGLDEAALIVRHAFASYGFRRQFMQSRGHIGGKLRQHKSAHIEVILQEGAGMQTSKPVKKAVKEVPKAADVKTEKAKPKQEKETPKPKAEEKKPKAVTAKKEEKNAKGSESK
jgi:large subunit ribosomal protein L22